MPSTGPSLLSQKRGSTCAPLKEPLSPTAATAWHFSPALVSWGNYGISSQSQMFLKVCSKLFSWPLAYDSLDKYLKSISSQPFLVTLWAKLFLAEKVYFSPSLITQKNLSRFSSSFPERSVHLCVDSKHRTFQLQRRSFLFKRQNNQKVLIHRIYEKTSLAYLLLLSILQQLST